MSVKTKIEKLNKILVILGPTATGKTKLAVKLALKFNGEIVSADSMQVYKGMNIGTGKDLNEYEIKNKSKILSNVKCQMSNVVPYHLIDVVSPNTDFNVAKFQKLAYKAIDDILSRGKLPIIVGGTGLYVSAVVDGLVLPKLQIANYKLQIIRNKLEKLSLKQLLARLKKVDLKTYEIIDQKNRRRVQRALEIYYETGVPKSKQQEKHPLYDCLQIGLSFSKEILHQRIEKRLDDWLLGGALIKEIKNLHYKQKVSWNRLESFGLEYKWGALYLQNKVEYEEMKENIARDIKRFAKRQMTWFKRDERIVWKSDFNQITKLINKFI